VRKLSLLIIGFLGIISLQGYAQQQNNLRNKAIALHLKDTLSLHDTIIRIDSLGILPNSLSLHLNGKQKLDSLFYKVDFIKGRLTLDLAGLKKNTVKADTLYCTYRVPIIPPKPIPFNQLTNQRKKTISVKGNDTIRIDTLSILPQSVHLITANGKILDSTYYTLEPAEGKIVLNSVALKKNGITSDSIYCAYRVFPFLLTQTHEHKDNNIMHPTKYGQQQGFIYQVDQNKNSNDPFDLGTLDKSGNISRGITFGNAQNLTVNSALNLQLAGKLSNNVNVLVSATDNSLPIQPEGNTATLQDFDKVFIKLYNKNTSLIAGDYELSSPSGYFMKYYKKAEGGMFSTRFIVGPEKDSNKAAYLRVTGGGAISKGKFASNNVTPIDGNMGPYRLTGSDNENFIVVLSGTEKVYLDGQLMLRGQNNDYTIDYNAAQITFTPKHLILQTTRIVVEFQYSDQTYLRSLYFAGTEYHNNKLNLRFNLYSEQDAKTQPLQQSLTFPQEQLMASVGNHIQNALVPGADSIAFNNTEVLYRKIDTINVALGFNDTIYVYSVDSTKAHYRLSFSQVNQGQGDYVEIPSAANGRVFKWVAPISGVRQGNYIAQVLLITPKKKQMITLGGDYKLSAGSSIQVETAVSNNDINTFSKLDKGQDVGFAGKLNFHNISFLQDTIEHKKDAWRVTTDVGYEGVQKDFSPIERYRPVEFSRDWNRTSDSIYADQNILSTTISLGNKRDLFGYGFQAFLEGGNYNATRQTAILKASEKNFTADFNGALLNTLSVDNKSNYYKEFGTLSYKIVHWVVGAGEGTENDIFRSRRTDSIVTNSTSLFEQASTFKYYQWNTFIHSADTSKLSYGINYQERTDFAPTEDEMVKSLFSKNISLNLNIVKNPKSRFKANVTYHILSVYDSALAQGQQPVNALVGQAQYDLNAAHGLIMSSTYYEAGSGLQPKESYTYVQVAQGQGIYAWTDFNGDGIKQLNEFYIAPFPDQADYIKVYTPTNQFIKTYTSGLTETFSLRPAALWANTKDIRSFFALFSEQLAFHTDKKSTSTNVAQVYNPLLQNANDTNLVGLNTTIRNTVFFNQLNPKFGADYSYNDAINKTTLQETGTQARENKYNELHGRFNYSTKWMIEDDEKFGNDISNSNYFTSNNFNILYYISQPKLSYQPSTSFRISVLYTFTDKLNSYSEGGGQSLQQNYGAELKYNVLNKGSLLANFNYINIKFNELANSPLGLEMLQGLNIGDNYTWGATYQCNISKNIQLNISYTGRDSEGSKLVNTGTAQVRAFF